MCKQTKKANDETFFGIDAIRFMASLRNNYIAYMFA